MLKFLKSRLFIVLLSAITICAITLISDEDYRESPSTFDLRRSPDWRILTTLIENLESIAIVSAAILYLKEAPERKRQSIYEAWQIIDNAYASKVETSYARIEALQFLVQENVSLRGIDLFNDSINQRFDLYGINLKGADLREATLNKADLSEADLRNAKLTNASLNGANLQGSKLNHARLNGASLRGTDLSQRKKDTDSNPCKKTNLENANMEGAKLDFELDLPDSSKPENLEMLYRIITDTSGREINQLSQHQRIKEFKKIIESGAYIKKTSLENANLVGANLKNAELAGVNFKGADLTNADLRGAVFQRNSGISDPLILGTNKTRYIIDSVIISASFEGAILKNTKLSQDLHQEQQAQCYIYEPIIESEQ